MIENDKQISFGNSHSTWAIAIAVAALILLMGSFAFLSVQQAAFSVAIAILTALVALHLHEERKCRRIWTAILSSLPTPFALAHVPGFFAEYAKLAGALTRIVQHNDLLFQALALTRLEKIADEVSTLARGQVVFNATETWRTAYQHVLETTHVKAYFSVAWVRSDDYWNDAPGRQSLQFNYDLIGRGFRIERIHILADEVWPFDEKLPTDSILNLLADQQERGIHVSLVRESDLVNEPDLLRDFAVYGDRATGNQNVDERSRTQSFVLSFDDVSLRQALGRWERLKLFSISYQNMMDRLDA